MNSNLPLLTEVQFNNFFTDLKESFEKQVNKNKLNSFNSLKNILKKMINEKNNYRKIILSKDKDKESYINFIGYLNLCIKYRKILNSNTLNSKNFVKYSKEDINIHLK
jgi:hypothetical protein